MLSKMNFHFCSADACESEQEPFLHDLPMKCHNNAEVMARLMFHLSCQISTTSTYHTLGQCDWSHAFLYSLWWRCQARPRLREIVTIFLFLISDGPHYVRNTAFILFIKWASHIMLYFLLPGMYAVTNPSKMVNSTFIFNDYLPRSIHYHRNLVHII